MGCDYYESTYLYFEYDINCDNEIKTKSKEILLDKSNGYIYVSIEEDFEEELNKRLNEDIEDKYYDFENCPTTFKRNISDYIRYNENLNFPNENYKMIEYPSDEELEIYLKINKLLNISNHTSIESLKNIINDKNKRNLCILNYVTTNFNIRNIKKTITRWKRT